MKIKITKPHYLGALWLEGSKYPWAMNMCATHPETHDRVWFLIGVYSSWYQAMQLTHVEYRRYWDLGFR